MMRRVAAFSDDYGLPLLLRHLPRGNLAAVVAASIRPHQHVALQGLAEREGVPLLVQPARHAPGYDAFLAAARATAADLVIVNSYSMKLWPELLALFPDGGINVHGGLLPQYRGANPVQWALLNDEREAGVTMHVLSVEIDGGPIVAQRSVPVLFEDTWRDVQDRIAAATEVLLAEALPRVLLGTAVAVAQDEQCARSFRRRRPEDGRFEWSWRVLDIYNMVRALVHPLPGAFFEHGNERIVLDRYLTISEVVALKYSEMGRGPLHVAKILMRPMALSPTNVEVLFMTEEPGRESRVVGIQRIDWKARRADLVAPDAPASVQGALRSFSCDELGVETS
jgi:methionyl-tRNA formyltransferase